MRWKIPYIDFGRLTINKKSSPFKFKKIMTNGDFVLRDEV